MEEHAVFWEAAEGALAEGKAEEVLEGAERLAECKICMVRTEIERTVVV